MDSRNKLKYFIFTLSYHLGLPIFCDFWKKGQIKILIYHGIPGQDHFDGIINYYGYAIPLKKFEQHLKYLKRRCNIISLTDLVTKTRLSQTKTNVLLTFDDGYESHFLNVFDLLKRYKLPAVFALPTAFVCRQEPLWDDIIEYAVNSSLKNKVKIKWDGIEKVFNINDFPGRLTLYNWLMRHCVKIDQKKRDCLIKSAVEALEVSASAQDMFQYSDYRPLTYEQINHILDSELVEFASHSVHHYLLAKCDEETRRFELVESKHHIESMTKIPCTVLSLPGGSYNSRVLSEAFKAGYEYIMTSDSGTAEATSHVLNRNGVFSQYDFFEFVDLVHGPVLQMIETTRRIRSGFYKKIHRKKYLYGQCSSETIS